MIRKESLPKVLLLLAAFVFFSANTVYFLEDPNGPVLASIDRNYHLNFDTVEKGPWLNLKAAVLVNADNGDVLYAKNADQPRPVASITKLVTAMVVIDHKVPLDSIVEITKEDAFRSSKSRLSRGFELTVLDLLYSALMNSDNRAARALARATCGDIDEFVREMNRKVQRLGLENTVFCEPTGLDEKNVSTAHEVAKILHYAYDYKLIKKITSQKRYRVKIQNKKNTYRQMSNTNLMVYSKYKVLAGKTGFIREADHCLTTLLQNKKGEKLTLVVLGVPGDKLRFREARRLADWGFNKI
ncbi:MAG: D-alanyl-D-alanine carboxypeptidase [candidate division Zixibacteria bacterium]|nr:D-alanyl-D-alanine carboxypeptidase [candidate division Zixibacteria bacterium]